MNDIFLDLTPPTGEQVLVNASHILSIRYNKETLCSTISLRDGSTVIVEESPNDIYMVIRSFQNERKNDK